MNLCAFANFRFSSLQIGFDRKHRPRKLYIFYKYSMTKVTAAAVVEAAFTTTIHRKLYEHGAQCCFWSCVVFFFYHSDYHLNILIRKALSCRSHYFTCYHRFHYYWCNRRKKRRRSHINRKIEIVRQRNRNRNQTHNLMYNRQTV